MSGVGVALLREDLALAAAAAGEVVLWEPAHIETTLQFVWLQARSAEPPLAALIGLVEDTWKPELRPSNWSPLADPVARVGRSFGASPRACKFR